MINVYLGITFQLFKAFIPVYVIIYFLFVCSYTIVANDNPSQRKEVCSFNYQTVIGLVGEIVMYPSKQTACFLTWRIND